MSKSIPQSTILSTKNLRLRIPSRTDFPSIFSATRYEGFNDGMLWEPPESEADLVKPLESGILGWENGSGYGFTIEQKKTSKFLGRISIRKTKELDRWNIGFWTHPKHQGKGIMTEAVSAILAFGFNQLDAKIIEADYATWNIASEKVLQKNGFQFVEFLEQGFFKNGKWVAENKVAIKLEDWLQPDTILK